MKIKNCKLKINNRGFTLVELLVYVGIFAVVSGLMIGIMTTTLRVNQRESASAEATSQLNFVLQTIQRLVRESSAIIVNSNSANVDTDDTVGSQQTLLVLRMKDSVGDNSTDRDPIIIYAENNVIKMSEGRLGYQRVSDLTNSRVLADNLKFTKYTQYPGQDTVGVDIQLTYNSQNPDSIVSRSLRTAIARVSAATFDSNLLPGTDNTYEIGYLAGNQRWKNISVSNLISTSNLLNLGQLSSDPSTDVQNGSIYYNTASSTFRGYKNSAWANLGGGDLWTASSTAIYYNTGNVGIGTTAPTGKLQIQNTVGFPTIFDYTADNRNYIRGVTYFDSGDKVYIAGNVGIGMTNPGAKLEVVDSPIFGGGTEKLRLGGGSLGFNRNVLTGAIYDSSSYAYQFQHTGSATQGSDYLALQVYNTAGTQITSSALVVNGYGNVGIGTTTPAVKLVVTQTAANEGVFFYAPVGAGNLSILSLYTNDGDRKFFFNNAGNAQADGSFSGGGADYAEYFENLSEGIIEKGTIVALQDGKLRPASKGDTFIAGVVSTFAGIIGNNGDTEEERDKYPERWTLVALMGQVPVKVKGNISHGDYIELDDNGVGKKARQWHLNVIGQAMEDYNSTDVGKIKVLIK